MKIIPIEERIDRNLIVRYDDDVGMSFKWIDESPDRGYTVCIVLDYDTITNLVDSMKRRKLI